MIVDPNSVLDEIANWTGAATEYFKGIEILKKYGAIDYWTLKKLEGGCDCFTEVHLLNAMSDLKKKALKMLPSDNSEIKTIKEQKNDKLRKNKKLV